MAALQAAQASAGAVRREPGEGAGEPVVEFVKKKVSGKHSKKEPAGLEQAASLRPEAGSKAAALHVPVLFSLVLSFVPVRQGLRILDGTLGMGGHSEGMLRLLREAGIEAELVGLDRDARALQLASERLAGAGFSGKVHLEQARFSEFAGVLDAKGWDTVDFALIDIGVSSMQIDSPDRGFSFHADGPLDMRMDSGTGKTAADLVNKAPVDTLRMLIADLGEEPMAGRIARAIDDARSQGPIESTAQLAHIVEQAYPAKWRATARNHPATRTFQALRMEVNNELGELSDFLGGIVPRLAPGGRVAAITFHSLEDRIVKHFFRDEATGCRCPRHVPVCICGHLPSLRVLTRKPLTASPEELAANPRASSAKLRVAERV